MNGIETKTSNKKVYFEVMRIIAAYFVIFNHTGDRGFFMFSQRPVGHANFWSYLFISIFCTFSVSLFFMISGALLLPKEEPVCVVWKKRLFPIVVTLFVFSLFYYTCNTYYNGESFEIRDFMRRLYSLHLSPHLWYLYAYIAFIMSLPFLRKLAHNVGGTHRFYYLIGLAFGFQSIVPCVDYLLFHGEISISGNLVPSWLLSDVVLYPLLGYFLEYYVDIHKAKKYIPFLIVADILTIIISGYMTYIRGLDMGVVFEEGKSQVFHKSFVMVNAITVFVSIKALCMSVSFPKTIVKFILTLGKCSFGIYLFHVFVKDRLGLWTIYDFMISLGMNAMLSSFVVCLIIMTVSYIITLIMSKVPVLRKLVGF